MEEIKLSTEALEKEIEENLDKCWKTLAVGTKENMPKEDWMSLMSYAQCLLGLHESIKAAIWAGNGINEIFSKYLYPVPEELTDKKEE